jgi:tetratricopeptide (TPR) repeat protein
VITGQYYEEGNRLHVTVEVIAVEAHRLLWRDSFRVPSEDLLSLRQEISRRLRSGMVSALGLDVVGNEGTRPRDPEAYEIYLRSLAVVRNPEPNKRAILMLERALELDPTFAPAWSELGRRLYDDVGWSDAGPSTVGRAYGALRRALELDPDSVQAAGRLTILQVGDGDHSAAFAAALELLRRRPDSAFAHFSLSYVLRYQGLLEAAAARCETALALDPFNPAWRSCGILYGFAGNFPRAKVFLDLDPDSVFTADIRGHHLLSQGRPDEALRSWTRLPESHPERRILSAFLSQAPDLSDVADEAEAEFQAEPDLEWQYFGGSVLAYVGQRKAALRLLRRAVEGNFCAFPAMDRDPVWDGVRSDPRFGEIRETAIACRERYLKEYLSSGADGDLAP